MANFLHGCQSQPFPDQFSEGKMNPAGRIFRVAKGLKKTIRRRDLYKARPFWGMDVDFGGRGTAPVSQRFNHLVPQGACPGKREDHSFCGSRSNQILLQGYRELSSDQGPGSPACKFQNRKRALCANCVRCRACLCGFPKPHTTP